VIRVYDTAGNVIETHDQAGEFKKVALDSFY
jgi:YD repeat-containing protein